MPKKKLDLNDHVLVPKHTKLTDKEKKDFLEKHNITVEQMPTINKKDAAIRGLSVKVGDVIKVERKSLTTGIYLFYRSVINE